MKRADLRIALWRLGLAVVVFGAWEAVVAVGWLNPFWASSPGRIAVALLDIVREPLFATHVLTTLTELVAGFLIGAVLGIAIGFVLAEWPVAEQVLAPYLAALNSLPRVALAPLFILWLGIGMGSKIVMAATLVVFIVIGNTLAAARNVDPDMLTVARLLGAGRGALFIKVVLPASAPVVFAGLRLGVIYSMLGAVVGEMIAANSGLGYMLSFYAGSFQVSHLMATLAILVALSTLLSGAMTWIELGLLNRRPRGATAAATRVRPQAAAAE